LFFILDTQTNAYRVYPNKYYEKTSSGIEDRYVYLGNLRILTDEKISQTASLYYNFSDHLNSSSITLDSSGNYVNLADYYPFGSAKINIQPGSYNPTYKFTDQEYDSESGIYYYDARYYNQNIGRFIQSDPLSLYLVNPQELTNNTQKSLTEILSNPQILNYYSYAGNNPIIYIDPDGNARWSFGSMLSNTYNAFKNYGGLITECIDAYRANANYQAVEKTKQYYNDYNNLSDQDKQSIFTNTREAYAQTQINMELSENAVLGMVGGGDVSLTKKASQELMTLYHGSSTKFSQVLENGFKNRDLWITPNIAHANSYALKFGSNNDSGVLKLIIPKSIIDDLITKGLALKNDIQEVLIRSEALDIINKFIQK